MVDDVHATKAELRAAILAARRAVPPDVRRAEADAFGEHLTALASAHPGETACAYVPVGSEPGSLEMLDALRAAGMTVLVPAAREDELFTPLPLSWGAYRPGRLVDAKYGLREPAAPWLPPEAIAGAAVIVVPALAVDRTGVRLGRGAGFYDRTLLLAGPSAQLIALVRDDELLDHVPGESHDVPMTHALTPHGGLVRLS